MVLWLIVAFVVGAVAGYYLAVKVMEGPRMALYAERDKARQECDQLREELETALHDLEYQTIVADETRAITTERNHLEHEVEGLRERLQEAERLVTFKANELERWKSGVDAFIAIRARPKKTAIPPITGVMEEVIRETYERKGSIRQTCLTLYGYEGGRAYDDVKRVVG